MITLVEPKDTTTLEDYGAYSHLSAAVEDLRHVAKEALRHINGRSILMVNSTSQGGGVAEMLPKMMGILNELGIKTRWAVMGSDDPAFFQLTKRLHNMIHGDGGGAPRLTEEDRRLFEYTGESNVDALRAILNPEDLLVIHDPQPLAMGAKLKTLLDLPAVWRCHIGLDERNRSTAAAWEFLKPYIQAFDHNIFSADEYVPDFVRDRSSVIFPAIDPLSYKNRTIRAEELTSILCNAGLGRLANPNLADPFPEPAQRLQPDGAFGPAGSPERIGFLYRPTITQISRWDRLKGWKPLLEGFIKIKKGLNGKSNSGDGRYRCRLEMLRLVMVGPDPASIQDDPEGCEVLNDLCTTYARLDPDIQKDVVLLTLPMSSRKNNALMVNAIQTASSIVVQNSIREGFGLTLTEAMWKGTPVVGSSACGLRQQIKDRIHGRVVLCPEDSEEVAQVLGDMLSADDKLDLWARNAKTRVQQEFLVFNQVKKWLKILDQFKTIPGTHSLGSGKSGGYSGGGHRTDIVHYPAS